MQKLIPSFLIALFYGQSLFSAQENLVKNPGFEEAVVPGRKPAQAWWLYEARGNPKLSINHATFHQGNASVRIEATNDTKCVLVSGPFTVAPGDELQLRAWVRGENLPRNQACAGFAFRRVDGGVFQRAYFQCSVTGSWSLISGVAQVPTEAATAEIHLNYTNAPGVVWFDDIFAAITNPISFSLAEGPKAWPGEHEISLRVATRQFKVPITLSRVGAHNYKLSLLNNVKGLWFYTGSGQRDWQGKPAGLLNCPDEGHWDYVQ